MPMMLNNRYSKLPIMFRSQAQGSSDEIKDEFLPRTDKYKNIINNHQMPSSNESLVIVPCLTKTYGFKTNQFRVQEKFLSGVIPDKQFNSFIRKANQIIERELISKSAKENEPFFGRIAVLRNISIVLAALALMLLAVIVYTDLSQSVSDAILYVTVVLLCGSGLIAGLCPVFLFNFKYTAHNYEQIITDKLKQLEAEENKFNASRGISQYIWCIEKNFYWIELHINRAMLDSR